MDLTKEHVGKAVEAGLGLTDPESDLLQVFRTHAAGILLLRQLLVCLGNGTVGLGPTVQTPPPSPPAAITGNKGPVPKRKVRNAVRKKKAKKKK